MNLGAFSVSLVVRDIQASRRFYEALGFEVIDGQFNHEGDIELDEGQDWLILQNESTTLGLFQEMLEGITLTFHPKDVRSIQSGLRQKGIELLVEADEDTEGPTAIMLSDPDGHRILMDQQ